MENAIAFIKLQIEQGGPLSETNVTGTPCVAMLFSSCQLFE